MANSKQFISITNITFQYFSFIKRIKAKIQTLTKTFEVSKTVSKSVKDIFTYVEAQNQVTLA